MTPKYIGRHLFVQYDDCCNFNEIIIQGKLVENRN